MFFSNKDTSPSTSRQSAKFFPRDIGNDGFWATMYTTPMIVSYNTNLVAPRDLPEDYSDLLGPKWKGRLGLDSSDFEWYANLRKVWGAEKAQKFLEGLRKQEVR